MKRVPARTRSGRPVLKAALSLAVVLPGMLALHESAHAQAPAPAPPAAPAVPVPAPATPAPAPIVLPAQPSAPTPPTPLPSSEPDTAVTGVKPSDIRKTAPFAAPPGQPQPGAPEAVLTLEDALRIAMDNNPNIKLATEAAVRTSNTVDQVRAASSPQINASATYARFFSPASASAAGFGGVSLGQIANPFGVGLQITPPGTIPITISNSSNSSGTFGSTSTAVTRLQSTRQETPVRSSSYESNNLSARIGVSQLIDLTGIVRTAIQYGELQEAQSRLELARTRQELALNVRSGYFNILRALGFVEVNQAAVAQAQENLRVTEAQLSAGVVSNFDVLRARTQLDNNQQALITARNQVNVAKNAFANLIGLDPSTPIEPAPPAETPVTNLQEADLIAQAYTMRPEYLQADVNLLKAEKNIRLSRRGQEPYMNVGVNGVLNANSGVPSDQRFAVAAGATLVFPLSDGGATRAAVENARSDERSARIQKDQFARGIKAEVQQALVAVRDARERLDVSSATVTQAAEALRLSNVRYQAGVGTQLEINDAQTALTLAQTNAVNARYDYLGALARLSRATGVPE